MRTASVGAPGHCWGRSDGRAGSCGATGSSKLPIYHKAHPRMKPPRSSAAPSICRAGGGYWQAHSGSPGEGRMNFRWLQTAAPLRDLLAKAVCLLDRGFTREKAPLARSGRVGSRRWQGPGQRHSKATVSTVARRSPCWWFRALSAGPRCEAAGDRLQTQLAAAACRTESGDREAFPSRGLQEPSVGADKVERCWILLARDQSCG